MKAAMIFSVIVFATLLADSLCSILATKGYALSTPRVRSLLIRTGLGNLIKRKAAAFYDVSNFRYASDQGTDVRKAQMDSYDIVEVDPNRKGETDFAAHEHNTTSDEDRVYSEKVFGVVNEMDKNGCVSRLLCEIGTDPKPFGFMGLKIHHYLKSVPPVTWNSATFPYIEAFQAGLSSRDVCVQHYSTCNYDLQRVMKFLWLFLRPIDLKAGPGF